MSLFNSRGILLDHVLEFDRHFMELDSQGHLLTFPFNILDHLQKSWSDPDDSRGQGFKGSSEIL